MKWTITQLAKNTKFTRTILYYHLGKKKENFILETIHYFGSLMGGYNSERLKYFSEKKYIESTFITRSIFEKCPEVPIFYFTHRYANNTFGKIIREYEELHLAKLKLFFPNLTEEEFKCLGTIMVGVAFSPHIKNTSDVRHMIKIAQFYFKNN